jgi:hypothetical protein
MLTLARVFLCFSVFGICGIDVRGDVKIFDFGLAKEVRPGHDEKDGAYNLTGDTGSPRYMVCYGLTPFMGLLKLPPRRNVFCDLVALVVLNSCIFLLYKRLSSIGSRSGPEQTVQ